MFPCSCRMEFATHDHSYHATQGLRQFDTHHFYPHSSLPPSQQYQHQTYGRQCHTQQCRPRPSRNAQHQHDTARDQQAEPYPHQRPLTRANDPLSFATPMPGHTSSPRFAPRVCRRFDGYVFALSRTKEYLLLYASFFHETLACFHLPVYNHRRTISYNRSNCYVCKRTRPDTRPTGTSNHPF